MTTRVYLSTAGRSLAPGEATVSVFDRGFLYGDSVYETLRTAGGHPIEMTRHLDRLHRSAAGIGLQIPFSDAELREAVRVTCVDAANPDHYIRIIVTRGTGPIMLDPRLSTSPLLVILVQALALPEPALYETGLRVRIVETDRSTYPDLTVVCGRPQTAADDDTARGECVRKPCAANQRCCGPERCCEIKTGTAKEPAALGPLSALAFSDLDCAAFDTCDPSVDRCD